MSDRSQEDTQDGTQVPETWAMSGIKELDALIRGCINPAYPRPDDVRGTKITVEFEPLYEAIEAGMKIVHYEARESAIELCARQMENFAKEADDATDPHAAMWAEECARRFRILKGNRP